MNHLITLKNWNKASIESVISLARKIKDDPKSYQEATLGKTLLMIFEKPSLRTRLSFEAGMTQMGGHAIYYHTGNSPMGTGKESISDSIKTASRFVDIIMARLFNHNDLVEMANYASIPVINALTDDSHPCQILADLFSIKEKKGNLSGLKLAYLGDGLNNVTHSLMVGCAKVGIDISIGCPSESDFMPREDINDFCQKLCKESKSNLFITSDPKEAVKNADIVYTDSWMSYHIPEQEEKSRINKLLPYQINKDILDLANSDVIFMNCLPARRGYEQTADVIDGPNSIVFDQAENRLHVQKAIILSLLEVS